MNSDHYLGRVDLNMEIQNKAEGKKTYKKRYDVKKLRNLESQGIIENKIRHILNVRELYNKYYL